MKTPSDFARSIRNAGLVMLIATATLVQACSSDAIPTGPSSVTPADVARPFAPESGRNRVYGTVTDDEGAPVGGVKVTVCSWTAVGPCSATVTESTGFYSISFVFAAGVSALTEKAGYESNWHSRNTPFAADFRFDLQIRRITP